MKSVGIKGIGYYVPNRIIDNKFFEERIDTSDEWIKTRTGIEERRFVEEGQATSDLCYEAALKALSSANFDKNNLDAIVVATCTPDYRFPMVACIVQKKLGLDSIPSFDLNAACSGFIYGLTVVESLIKSGIYKNILFIGGETLSSFINFEDRNTCVLFGDGATAVIVSEVESGYGILSRELGAEGDEKLNLNIKASGSKHKITEESIKNGDIYLTMKGQEVFKFASRILPKVTLKAIESANILPENLKMVFPHQANIRIIESAAKRMKLDLDKFYVNLQKYGNTSAASVGIALGEAVEKNIIKTGDYIALTGFGAGLTYGSIVMKWAM